MKLSEDGNTPSALIIQVSRSSKEPECEEENAEGMLFKPITAKLIWNFSFQNDSLYLFLPYC